MEDDVAMPWGRPLEAKNWMISFAPGRSCGEDSKEARRIE